VARLALGTFAADKGDVGQEFDRLLASPVEGDERDERDESIARRLVKTVADCPGDFPLVASLLAKGTHATAHVNCIVLPGGEDIAPALYGSDGNGGARWDGDHRRSLLELGLVHAAFERGIPLMAICRGFQLTSVYHGARLIAHVGDEQVGVRRLNSAPVDRPAGQPEGQYGKLLDQLQTAVYHHQAVPAQTDMPHVVASSTRRLTEGGDGPWNVAMAIEPKAGAPLVGVQFHPELHAASASATPAEWTNEELLQLARSWSRPGSNEHGLREPADMVASGILAHTSSGNDDLWRLLATAARAHRAKVSLGGAELAVRHDTLAHHAESPYSNEVVALRQPSPPPRQ
jgi:putative glutamine amidotransferase